MNACFALVAGVLNIREARHGFQQWAVLRYLTAAYAFFYVLSYGVLLSGVVDRLAWSRFMVGVGTSCWVVVWWGPSLVMKRVVGKLVDDVNTYRSIPTVTEPRMTHKAGNETK